jgi:protoheme ferro-lyase
MAAKETKTGVCLLYIGGPTSQAEVEPYLRCLFSDRELIRLPG